MSDKPLIIVEPSAVQITAKAAQGYDVCALPTNPNAELDDFTDRRVILWPDASSESRLAFKKFGAKLKDLALEIKMIIPNGRPHGWNIAYAVAEGMTWNDMAAWAKGSMMVFNKGEFPRIIVETSEAPDPVPASVETVWEEIGIARAKNGDPINNVDNVVRILANWPAFKDMLWYDEFHQRYFTTWGGAGQREWRDIDDVNMTVLLQREFGFPRLQEATVSAGVRCRAHQYVKNEPKDWMGTLRWDGRPRIDEFFSVYLGAQDNGYCRAVGRNFWIGMVARIYRPGCQLDNMVILEGKQGIFKSKALSAVGGPWYMEAAEEITSKDFFGALSGKLIIEIADLDAFSRADTNRIKKVITCRTDRYRVPYGRATQDFPRQSIFVGTTNEEHYLRDATGARRFWPIRCGGIALERIKRDREQLFAEAVTRYLTNEDWYKVPHDETLEAQEERRQFDEWENIIAMYLQVCGLDELTMTEVGAQVGVDKSKMDIIVQRRLGSIMRRMKWMPTTKRAGAIVTRVWRPVSSAPPEHTIDLLPSGQQALSLPVTD